MSRRTTQKIEQRKKELAAGTIPQKLTYPEEVEAADTPPVKIAKPKAKKSK